MNRYSLVFCTVSVICLCVFACKKVIQIDPPRNSIVTSEVFSDSADAEAGILGVYASCFNQSGSLSFGNGAVTIYCGASADELIPFFLNHIDDKLLYHNQLTAFNGLATSFWTQIYATIFQANSCIEGLSASTRISSSLKTRLSAEAKLIRAFCYFYLINLYGDAPYPTKASDWAQTAVAKRESVATIYNNLVKDLIQCKNDLPVNYSLYKNERIRGTKAVASALLSRIYLYTNDWQNALNESNDIIGNPLYTLDSSLNDVFLANTPEAILQWKPNVAWNPFDATPEAYNLLPDDTLSRPLSYYISPTLINAFDSGDLRKINWITYTNYNGIYYYLPFKYKVGSILQNATPNATEYYTVLRLAEQYLIRAEAEVQLNDKTDAISDINVIRKRAGIDKLPDTMSLQSVVKAIAHERQIELFAEWGHRWFDLKRTGQIDAVMSIVTPAKKNGGNAWDTHQQLYPIPTSELKNDPNLTQNAGY